MGKFPVNERKDVTVTLQNELYTTPVVFEKSKTKDLYQRVVRDPQGNVLRQSQGWNDECAGILNVGAGVEETFNSRG